MPWSSERGAEGRGREGREDTLRPLQVGRYYLKDKSSLYHSINYNAIYELTSLFFSFFLGHTFHRVINYCIVYRVHGLYGIRMRIPWDHARVQVRYF